MEAMKNAMAKPNMALEKVPMPERDPKERATCFEEVATGYTPEMAMEEATRCLNCKAKPCVSGCPVGVRIPEFIQQMAAGNFLEAYQIITSTNSLPAVCGRVCPQESQCEGKCVRGKKGQPVGIGRLERFAADYAREHGNLQAKPVAPNGHKVAVVGGGPAGLTCAGDLARLGYQVTIFEAFQVAGGVLMYGIPEFRLPKSIVQKEVKTLEELGVEIRPNMVIGKILSIDELMEDGYEAVFVGSGAGLPRFMGIPGESLVGVCSANEYLTRINLMKGYREEYDTPVIKSKAVAVVGGGNVAMDAARSALRMGAEHVYIVYRRSEAEMPARKEEVHHAKEEGVEFRTGVDVGKDISAEQLLKEYDAVILACGSSNPRNINADGRDADGIYYAVDFLKATTKSLINSNLSDGYYISAKYKNVIVIGGGDTGNDCVGTAIRHGCKSVVQLEMMPKLPDTRAESNPWPEWPRVCKTDYGQEEAIAVFGHDPRIYQTTVKRFIKDDKNHVRAVETIKLQSVHDPKTGRMRMEEIEGSEQILDADLVLIAAGFLGAQAYVTDAFGVETTPRTNVSTKIGHYSTSVEKVFTAGDMHRGQSLVVWAIREGREAAKEVDQYLMGYTNLN